jgi:hypothetical protein
MVNKRACCFLPSDPRVCGRQRVAPLIGLQILQSLAAEAIRALHSQCPVVGFAAA